MPPRLPRVKRIMKNTKHPNWGTVYRPVSRTGSGADPDPPEAGRRTAAAVRAAPPSRNATEGLSGARSGSSPRFPRAASPVRRLGFRRGSATLPARPTGFFYSSRPNPHRGGQMNGGNKGRAVRHLCSTTFRKPSLTSAYRPFFRIVKKRKSDHYR